MGPAGGIPTALSLGVGVLNEGVIPPPQQGLMWGGGPLSWQGEGGGHSPSRNGRSHSASPRRAPPGRGATSPPAHRNAPRRHNLQMNSHPIIGTTPPRKKSPPSRGHPPAAAPMGRTESGTAPSGTDPVIGTERRHGQAEGGGHGVGGA